MLPALEPLGPCPGCANPDAQPLHVVRNKRQVVPVPYLCLAGCSRCGLVYLMPRPDPDALSGFYGAHETGGWERSLDPSDVARTIEKKRHAARRDLARVPGALDAATGRRALDVGCGAGAVLDVLADAGWETWGVEPGTLATVAAARHRLVEAIPASGAFGLIVLHHVLEHLLEPASTLDGLRRIAAPDAFLLVSVPSLDDLPRTGDFNYVSSPVHINSFTAPALANLFRITGWAPIDVASHGSRVLGLGRAADTQPPAPGALDTGVHSLREYGRRLDSSGRFVEPGDPTPAS